MAGGSYGLRIVWTEDRMAGGSYGWRILGLQDRMPGIVSLYNRTMDI